MNTFLSKAQSFFPIVLISAVAAFGFAMVRTDISSLWNAILQAGNVIESVSENTFLSQNSDSANSEDIVSASVSEGSTKFEHQIQSSQAAAAAVSGCVVDATITPNVVATTGGGDVEYAILVRNIGTVTCQNVSYSLYYSDNVMYVTAAPSPTASNYYWRIGSVAPNESQTVSLQVKHNTFVEGDALSLEMCATADNGQDSCTLSLVEVGETLVQAEPSSNEEIDTGMNQVVQPAPTTGSSVAREQENGVWVWESPIEMSRARASFVVNSAADHGFNVIYITIDDYLKIVVQPNGATKQAQKDAYFLALSKIVLDANAKGVSIDVEGGWRDWAIPENRWKGYALIDFVKEYNQRYPNAKVRGLQYDVEPYLLPTYERNKVGALKPFVEFIDESTKRMEAVDATFTVVIPHFYDSKQKWTPAINYKGTTKHTFTHLLAILERKPGSMITLMSYRNFYSGKDGTEQISKAEIAEASSGSYSTKIIVAQETGDVDPAYVTFFGMTKNDLNKNLVLIREGFAPYSQFGGVATHYLDPFLELK